jgi:uncharacterized protein (DUF362 family)
MIIYSITGFFSLLGFSLKNFFLGKIMAESPNSPRSQPHPVTVKNTSKVVSVFSAKAANWDGTSYPYVDAIDQAVVEKMLQNAIMELTSAKSPVNAWETLFSTYRPGDLIVIKPNFNDLYKEFNNNLVASPAVINAILSGLVEHLGVHPQNIIIYDCTRKIPNAFRERIYYSVRYVEAWASSLVRKFQYKLVGNPLPKANERFEIKMTKNIKDEQGRQIKCYLPKVITEAQHIINVPILKSHQFVLASGALKNHYGTVRFSDGITGPVYLHPPVIHESIVDVNIHPQIREKTCLVVMDAIFGRLKKKGGPPDKWLIFGESHPQRLFVSRDPVALDAVTSHLVKSELEKRNETYFANNYLKMASKRGLGVFEEPDPQGLFKTIEYQQLEI